MVAAKETKHAAYYSTGVKGCIDIYVHPLLNIVFFSVYIHYIIY